MGYVDNVTHRGVILTPSSGGIVFIAGTIDFNVPVASAVHEPPFSAAPVIVSGERKKNRGTISGQLIECNEDGTAGSAVSAKTFLDRLHALVNNQGTKTIALSCRDFTATSVKFAEGYTAVPALEARRYEVTLRWWEI